MKANNKNKLNKRPYDLYSLLSAYAKEVITKLFVRDAEVDFPETIGNYKFIEKLKKEGPKKSYQLAVYTDPNGKRAIAKMRSSKIKGYHYYSLKNEIEVYKVLNVVVSRERSELEKKFPNIKIPKLIKSEETENGLILLTEFVEGEPTIRLNPREKVVIYFSMADFLCFIGTKLTDDERSRISTRSVLDLLFLYPFLLVNSLVNYPLYSLYLLAGGVYFINSIPYLNKKRREVLTHRDLHFYNILKSGDRLALIDLQQCVFTELFQEHVTILRYYWKEDAFTSLFVSEILKRYGNDQSIFFVIRGLIVNSITHGFTDKSFPKEIVNKSVDLLKFSIAPNFRERIGGLCG